MRLHKFAAVAGAAALAATAFGATAASAAPIPARFTGTDSGASAYQVPAGGAAYAASFKVTYWRYDSEWLADGTTMLKVTGKYATVTPAGLYLPQRSNGPAVTESATVKIAVPAGAPAGTYTDTVTATESNSQPVVFHFSIVVPPPESAAQLCESYGGVFGNTNLTFGRWPTILWTCNGFPYVSDADLQAKIVMLWAACVAGGGTGYGYGGPYVPPMTVDFTCGQS